MADNGPRIVVLRFASGLRVDLVDGLSEEDAVADFAGRSMRAGTVELPLYEARTAAVPIERLRELAGLDPPPAPVPRPRLSPVGLIGAVRGYTSSLAADRSSPAVAEAGKRLVEFFDRYGIDIDFRVAAPMRKVEE